MRENTELNGMTPAEDRAVNAAEQSAEERSPARGAENAGEGREKLVILTGPTAVGKSALSIGLCRRIGGEVISADSMQVYRGMDIGSAKIRPEETGGIAHHLIDILEPEEEFNVVRFQALALDCIRDIASRGRIPVIVGGTGFYIQSVLYGIHFTENDGDDAYRRSLQALAQEEGGREKLAAMLRQADPESARLIHPNNVQRTIRALEFARQTGGAISAHNLEERAREAPWNFAYFVLTDDREEIYRRIDARVGQMMDEGLVEEVRRLKDRGLTEDFTSMHGLGYREMLHYLDGETDLEETVRLIRRNTRHFAKRQLTWFRRERDVTWIDRREYGGEEERILDAMAEVLRARGIV